jgi:hypothetical protein
LVEGSVIFTAGSPVANGVKEAAELRWRLRKHFWFWAIILFILLLHIPLFSIVRWPQGNIPTIAYTMPLGIADFLLIMGAIGLAERVFSKASSSKDEEE